MKYEINAYNEYNYRDGRIGLAQREGGKKKRLIPSRTKDGSLSYKRLGER